MEDFYRNKGVAGELLAKELFLDQDIFWGERERARVLLCKLPLLPMGGCGEGPYDKLPDWC